MGPLSQRIYNLSWLDMTQYITEKKAVRREWDEELIQLLMIKDVVPAKLHFSVKPLKSTFKRENTGCTINSFSTGLVEEGIFRTGLKQKSPVLSE